jgi:hypothetical protein
LTTGNEPTGLSGPVSVVPIGLFVSVFGGGGAFVTKLSNDGLPPIVAVEVANEFVG